MAKAEVKKEVKEIGLQNLEKRIATFNLDHPAHKKKRIFPVVVELKDGSSIGQMKARNLADSLTLLARESRFDLPETILQCSEIKSALEARPPRLRKVEPPKPAAKKNRGKKGSE